MASWRAPGSLLEAPGLDFPGSGADFFEIFACLGAGGLEAVPPEIPPAIPPEILASSHQEWPRIAQCQERQKRQELPRVKIASPERPEQKVGAGGPRRGGFNGIGAKLAILASQNFIFLQERQNEAKRYFKSASRTPKRP